MALTTQQKESLISEFRTAGAELVNSLARYRAARVQYDALDFGNAITASDLSADVNKNLTTIEFTSLVAALEAVDTVFLINKTNIYKGKL